MGVGADRRLVDLVLGFAALKVGLVAVALLAYWLLPFNWTLYNSNLLLDVERLPELFRSWNTWDTQHYLFLAQRGYGVNPMSDAFYPLFPYLIWVLTPLFFGRGLLAAYFIANLVSFLVPVYMYKLCRLFHGEEESFRSTVLLLAFPTAFFLSVAYTESLFLALCLMAFYHLFKEDVWKASLACVLLPLARPQAMLFVVPIAVLFAHRLLKALRDGAGLGAGMSRAARTLLAPALATVLGVAAYLALCRWQLGGFFEGLRAQQLYVAKNSLGNLLAPQRWFWSNFVETDLAVHGYTNSAIDRIAFALALPVLFGVWRREHPALFAYAAVALLVPALAGSFMSYTRVVLAVFPLFMYLGARFERSWCLAVVLFCLQILFYVLHTGGSWVA